MWKPASRMGDAMAGRLREMSFEVVATSLSARLQDVLSAGPRPAPSEAPSSSCVPRAGSFHMCHRDYSSQQVKLYYVLRGWFLR